MKTIVSLIGLISTIAISNALAWERVLLDTYTALQNWEISRPASASPKESYILDRRVPVHRD